MDWAQSSQPKTKIEQKQCRIVCLEKLAHHDSLFIPVGIKQLPSDIVHFNTRLFVTSTRLVLAKVLREVREFCPDANFSSCE